MSFVLAVVLTIGLLLLEKKFNISKEARPTFISSTAAAVALMLLAWKSAFLGVLGFTAFVALYAYILLFGSMKVENLHDYLKNIRRRTYTTNSRWLPDKALFFVGSQRVGYEDIDWYLAPDFVHGVIGYIDSEQPTVLRYDTFLDRLSNVLRFPLNRLTIAKTAALIHENRDKILTTWEDLGSFRVQTEIYWRRRFELKKISDEGDTWYVQGYRHPHVVKREEK